MVIAISRIKDMQVLIRFILQDRNRERFLHQHKNKKQSAKMAFLYLYINFGLYYSASGKYAAWI
jgi:hypothetical protein